MALGILGTVVRENRAMGDYVGVERGEVSNINM